MICLFNKYKKSVQKRTDFFDNSFFNAVPDKPLATRNKPHNNQLCADLSRFISAYPVVSHFLRFAWQTTSTPLLPRSFLLYYTPILPTGQPRIKAKRGKTNIRRPFSSRRIYFCSFDSITAVLLLYSFLQAQLSLHLQ